MSSEIASAEKSVASKEIEGSLVELKKAEIEAAKAVEDALSRKESRIVAAKGEAGKIAERAEEERKRAVEVLYRKERTEIEKAVDKLAHTAKAEADHVRKEGEKKASAVAKRLLTQFFE